MYVQKLKEMFARMVVPKDSSLIPFYYHPEFLLYTNDQIMDFENFLESHQEYYSSPKQYHIEYDDESFLEQGDKIAGRMWITVSLPNEVPKKIELILIAQYKDSKIYRLWELTYPDWSKLPEFE